MMSVEERRVEINDRFCSLPDFNELNSASIKSELRDACLVLEIDHDIKQSLLYNIEQVDHVDVLHRASVVLSVINITGIIQDHYQLEEFLKGGHTVLQDSGVLYDLLEDKHYVCERISSHYVKCKADSDLSMQADGIFNELLIGKTAEGNTWFQLEGHSTGGIMNFIGHGVDYLYYCMSGKNVSQYGSSVHTDTNPIKLVGLIEFDNL
jgi:hypothetical protein